ncbi:hypothetical protein ACFLTT_00580 [Chloroflexota bacterium]
MTRKTIIQLVFAMLTSFNVAVPLILNMQTIAPTWPWQLHALIGFIAFFIVIASIIIDKQREINKLENSYEYVLFFNGLIVNPVGEMLEVDLNLTNTHEKAIEYIVESIYLEIGGNCILDSQYRNRGQVISGKQSGVFKYPAVRIPNSIPCEGLLRYELIYGRPKKPMFRQIKEMKLTLRTVGQSNNLLWQFTQEEDSPIKK